MTRCVLSDLLIEETQIRLTVVSQPDALVLLRKTLYHTAPRTIRKIPKRRTRDVVRAAFDSTDDPSAPPPQSVSEQQHMADVVPMHGLNIWAALMASVTLLRLKTYC